MADVMAKLAAWIEEAVEYVNSETRSPSLEREGRALLAAYEQSQAEPKQAAEPFAYVDRVSLLWLSDEVRTPVARVEASLYKTAPGDGWVGVYLAAPVAQAATPAPAPLTNAQFERLYNNLPPSIQQDARSRLAFIRIGRAVEAAHGIGKEASNG